MKRAKPKKKKSAIDKPAKTPLEIVKTSNYVNVASLVMTLWMVYGWRHKRIAAFLEAHMALLDESRRFGYHRLIQDTKALTGVDVIALVDSLYTKDGEKV